MFCNRFSTSSDDEISIAEIDNDEISDFHQDFDSSKDSNDISNYSSEDLEMNDVITHRKRKRSTKVVNTESQVDKLPE